MIRLYSEIAQGQAWVQRYRGCLPYFACILGFTETGLLPGISAAGATPEDRQYTALADAEFLLGGPVTAPVHPLPPLTAGASPVLITRALTQAQEIPVQVFNAGLPHAPTFPAINVGGSPARCVSTGRALNRDTVESLLQAGDHWGRWLATQVPGSYVILAECVVGGTTTALGILEGLGYNATGKINSSHPTCNHAQKYQLVQQGLRQAGLLNSSGSPDPLQVAAAVGDPMQIVVAGMAIAASRTCGVLLAGGTQMLAVYALARAIAQTYSHHWEPTQIVVGTTRWVAEDPTGDTIGLAKMIGQVPLLGSQLSFTTADYPQLRAYEQGYVKEGVGAGGCAIAAHLYQGWNQEQLLNAIQTLAANYQQISSQSAPGFKPEN